jgi:hypothetical protein
MYQSQTGAIGAYNTLNGHSSQFKTLLKSDFNQSDFETKISLNTTQSFYENCYRIFR